MADLTTEARESVEVLLQSDEEQLYQDLGLRLKAMEQDPSIASSFNPDVTATGATMMGFQDELIKFGKRVFRRWNKEAYKLMCGADPEDKEDREKLTRALNIGPGEVATMMAGALVLKFGIAPAIAAVVAALIVKRFFSSAYEEFCETWKGELPKD